MTLGLVAVLSLLAGACGDGEAVSADRAPTAPDARTTEGEPTGGDETVASETELIKVAGGQMVPRAGIDVGIEKGYYEEEGLEIEIVEIQSGADQVPLLSSGQVDVTITGPASTHYNALSAGIPVKFVAPCGSSSADGEVPNLIVSVRKDLYDSGEVTSIDDLEGRKFGIPNLESKGYADAVTYLDMAGLSVDDVELVQPLSFPDTASGLSSGAIDVGLLVEPFASLGEMKGESVVIGGDHMIMPLRLGCSLVYGSRLVEDRDLGDRFMRAYLRAVRDYHDAFFNDQGKAEIVDILTRVTPVTDPTMFDRMIPNYIDPNGEISRESLELDIAIYLDEGFLSEEPDIDDIVDTGYAERAVEELGRYETH